MHGFGGSHCPFCSSASHDPMYVLIRKNVLKVRSYLKISDLCLTNPWQFPADPLNAPGLELAPVLGLSWNAWIQGRI